MNCSKALQCVASKKRQFLLGCVCSVLCVTILYWRIALNVRGISVAEQNASKVPVAAAATAVCVLTSKLQRQIPYKSVVGDNNTSRVCRRFAPILTNALRQTLRRTVQVLTSGLEDADVPYHMCAGTLLGSYLHHGIIPWDDDADLFVAYRDRQRLLDTLLKIERSSYSDENRYSFHVSDKHYRWKFFSLNGTVRIERHGGQVYRWRAPFVDVCLYDEDNNTIWDKSLGPPLQNRKRFKKNIVFPLGKRPFEGTMLSAPFNTHAYLTHNYNLEWCVNNRYSHLTETNFKRPIARVPCRQLWPFYPFVFRSPLSGGRILETLKVNDTIFNRIIMDKYGLPLLTWRKPIHCRPQ